jgi:hypothetical protein
MSKAILMSIKPENLINILNHNKTLELRKSVPTNFVGWVYLYCQKGRPYYTQQSKEKYTVQERNDYTNTINGKIVARFWFDCYSWLATDEDGWFNQFMLNDLCLEQYEVDIYAKENYEKLFAWHIKNLEIFDKPIELREFQKYVKKTIYCGMDCPPYQDEVLVQLSKAPQSWQYVWVKQNAR